jgi:hypothetical protein
MSHMVVFALVALGQLGGGLEEWKDFEPQYKLVRVPEPERFVRRPGARNYWSDGATTRFVGALAGGAIGATLPIVLGLAIQPRCSTPCAMSPVVAVLGLLAPLTSITGATAAWALLGGEISPGAAVAGAIAGLATGSLFLLGTATLRPTQPSAWPFVVVASGVAVSAVALALEARHEALEEAPFVAAPVGRFIATSLTMLGMLGLGALLSFGLGTLAGSPALAIGLGFVSLGLAPLIPMAVHQGMGGRGTAMWSYLGWLVSLGVGAAAGLATVLAVSAGAFRLGDARLDTTLIMAASTAGLAAVFGVPLFLELSNGRELLERSDVAGQPRLSLAPIQGGAMGTLALSF